MPLPIVRKSEFGVNGFTTRKYMQPGEQDVLLALVNSVAPRSMVEIGVCCGLTAQAVLQNIDSIERYVGIDVGPDYRFEIPAQQGEWTDHPGCLVKHDPRFELVFREQGVIDLQRPYDVVFIDGDHGSYAVLQDSVLAEHLIAPGGIILFHDYGNQTVQVTEVLDELHASGRDIRHVEGTWLAFEYR